MFESHAAPAESSRRGVAAFVGDLLDRLTVKLALPMAVVILVVAAATGFLVERAIRRSIVVSADAQARSQTASVIQALEMSDRLLLDETKRAMRVMQSEAAKTGAPAQGTGVQVGGRTVWDLNLGGTGQSSASDIVDQVGALMGGTATIYTKSTGDYVAISTNAKAATGERLVGAPLFRHGKAHTALERGASHYGFEREGAEPHIAAYEPLIDETGKTVGALHVGFPLVTLADLGATVEGTRLLDEGFSALVDSEGNVLFKSKHADANFVRELVNAKTGGKLSGEVKASVMSGMGKLDTAREIGNWQFIRSDFKPWGYTVVSAYSKADPQLTAAINRVRSTVAVVGLLLAIALTALCLLIARRITQPLNQAVKVANSLAVGDLSVDMSMPRSGDETGQLLVAMEKMTKYLQEMADTSDRIAAGDLSVGVAARNERDRFGRSFESMTGYLRSMASVSDEIAAGNLHVRVEPRSAEDRFGTAFKNMLDNTLGLVQSREERDRIQQSVMKLLEEVSDVANGDLRVEAEVTADATGAIADAFNYMIAELRQVITNVQRATLEVSSSADQIRSTTENLAAGSAAQARQIADTSLAIDEMAVSIRHVSDNADLSATVADEALSNARRGTHAVENNIAAMGKIRDQVQETSKRMKRLGERSQEIGEFVQLIDDIADRTSLLALNASIQAATAGEAGRGFAVVAEEVERLAERSAGATRQIATLVKAIQSETTAAVAAMEGTTREVVDGSALANDAGRALSEIEIVSQRLASLLGTISEASRRQARGSEDLSRSMTDISGVTQQVAAGSSQAAHSVLNLVALADTLRESVVTFKLPEDAPAEAAEHHTIEHDGVGHTQAEHEFPSNADARPQDHEDEDHRDEHGNRRSPVIATPDGEADERSEAEPALDDLSLSVPPFAALPEAAVSRS